MTGHAGTRNLTPMRLRLLAVFVFGVYACGGEDEPQRLLTGFRFTEGPAADAKGNVYFTDIPHERIHKVDLAGKLTTFREQSGRANGLMFNGAGELVACEGGTGRVVTIAPDGKKVRVLAETYGGKRFNAPNDLVIDKHGGVYFTDPNFGRKDKKPQKTLAVYYVSEAKKVARVIENLPRPNGIILSPNEKTLYVVPSDAETVMAYPVGEPGQLGKGRVFFRLKQPWWRTNTGGDGLTVDTKGNLYITSQLGIQIVNPEGALVRVLGFPEKPANVTFGGKDFKTLYVTARTSVYTLRMDATGHVFPAGRCMDQRSDPSSASAALRIDSVCKRVR